MCAWRFCSQWFFQFVGEGRGGETRLVPSLRVYRMSPIPYRVSSVIRGLEVSEAPEVVQGCRPSPPLSAPRGGHREARRG